MRIHQNSVFLNQLVKDVAAGALVPAAFQRPYSWSQSDVLAMCESILQGYPLGGFLTWTPTRDVRLASVGRQRLGPIVPDGTASIERLLLDGQNRLASLAWMLREPGTPLPQGIMACERSTWGNEQALVINMATRKFAFVPEARASEGYLLPARCAFGGAETNSIIRKLWDTAWAGLPENDKNDDLHWLDRQVMDKFRDARVVETWLENATVAEAKKAFLHICRVGVPMSDKDFDAAMRWTEAA